MTYISKSIDRINIRSKTNSRLKCLFLRCLMAPAQGSGNVMESYGELDSGVCENVTVLLSP